MTRTRLAGAAAVLLASGCGADESRHTPAAGAAEECVAPNRVVNATCLPPGVQDDGCPAGTLGRDDGSCQPAGVPPELCAEGFTHDGDAACEPILPADPCAPGQMAVPGESECRPVMPCGEGPWGDLPVDGATEYVDASYAGSDSDGSAQKPWTTIGAAVSAAAADALIAVAAGTYAEQVYIDRSVRLWGVCPAKVTIAGAGPQPAAVVVYGAAADGSEIGGMAITSNGFGIGVANVQDALLDRVWVHDTPQVGVVVQEQGVTTRVLVRGVLVEQARMHGVVVNGSQLDVERSVLRATQPRAPDHKFGRGMSVFPTDASPSNVLLSGSLVDQNRETGIYVLSSETRIEGSVVRGTLPQASDQQYGDGVEVDAEPDLGQSASLTVRSSLIADNHQSGVHVHDSDALIEGSVVRGNLPAGSDQMFGRGINAHCATTLCAPTRVTVVASLVERNHDEGVFVSGAELTVESTIVRHTEGSTPNSEFGRGIGAQLNRDKGIPSVVSVRGSRIEDNHQTGVAVQGSQATIVGSVIGDTHPSGPGWFGDGVEVESAEGFPASVSIDAVHIQGSARAGIVSFGAFVSVHATTVQCSAIDLTGEEDEHGTAFQFEDRGNNLCGCPEAAGACKVVSVGLEPPKPAPE